MNVNQILLTKDGRIIGNAIIIDVNSEDIFRIKTDYGNICTMTKKEIEKHYYIADDYQMMNVETHKHHIKE